MSAGDIMVLVVILAVVVVILASMATRHLGAARQARVEQLQRILSEVE